MPRTLEVLGVAGARVDRLLADADPTLSRAVAKKLVAEGIATINGMPAKPGHRLLGGERIVAQVPDPAPALPIAQSIPVDILYADEDVIVVDKPAGLVVHPAAGHEDGTLVNALLGMLGELPGINGSRRPGIVHRLDKDTSGVIIVAKTERGERSIARQLRAGLVKKAYLALVQGHPDPPQGVIDAPIGRDPRHRQRMGVVGGGRPARTEYHRVEEIGGYSLLEARLITGRTHQIRVHFAAIGYPIVGDKVYGVAAPKGAVLLRQFLHARRIGFGRPCDGHWVEVESPLPADLAAFLAALR